MHESEYKYWLISARGKYDTVKNYLEASKDDPPHEPYRSKYKAKDVLTVLLSEIEKWKSNESLCITVLHALFKYELGVIALETEEYSTGSDFLSSSWEEIKDCSGKPESCVLAISILNQLGILWSGRGEPSKALTYLVEAEKIYNDYKANSEVCPYTFEDIFEAHDIVKDDWSPFEKVFTHTLYYLAQVYEHLNESDKSAKYCHETLRRQKTFNEFEPNEWSVNCATLSQYYIQGKMFEIARHLLACAENTLMKHESKLRAEENNEDTWDELRRSKAEVAWCWLKYCINLLVESQNISDDGDDESQNKEQSYRLFENAEILAVENEVPAKVSDFEDAKKVFIFGQNQVTEAKVYYTLSHHANNHVQITQDHSKLYKNLAQYESDLSRQCKMHKRRIDMLESVLTKLNPQYYLAVCRQLMFELGETCYEMIDLKLKITNSSSQGLSGLAIKKINTLITHGIDHFKNFIESLKDHNASLPEVFADDLVRPALIANFYLGGLYSKFIESDTAKKLKKLKKSEEYYKFIVDYTEKNPTQVDCIEKELPVIKEMIELMPERMMQVTGSTIF